MWLYALERPFNDVRILVRDTLAHDSSCEAIQLLGPNAISGVRVEGFRAVRSGGTLAAIQTKGFMSVGDAISLGGVSPDIVQVPVGFELADEGGNRGWTSLSTTAPDPPGCRAVEIPATEPSVGIYPAAPPHASARQ